jgi:hypothetical protein
VPRFATCTVAAVIAERAGLQRLRLDDGSLAYVLTDVIGTAAVGDRVVINTTAVELGLGTGGWHVVHWNLARDALAGTGGGPVMKVRYTSTQVDTGASEERHRDTPAAVTPGLPIVVCGLHSQIAAVAAVVRAHRPDWRIAYVMTDAAALPLALSDLVVDMREAGLLDVTVSAGQAFGGDLEAVNPASAMAMACHVAGADVVIAGMGPGGVGTGTDLGFGALEVGGLLDTAAWLGGQPIACLRYSDADPRPRHRGVSRHSIVALCRAAAPGALVAVPEGSRAAAIEAALAESRISVRHRVVTVPVPDVDALLAAAGVAVTTMGRKPSDDAGFFTVAGAAGVVAAWSEGETATVLL